MNTTNKFQLSAIVFLITIILTGCSTNGVVIRYFYGEMDDKLYDRIVSYATFTKSQKEQIRISVDEYSNWHKLNELPRYEIFLKQIATQITTGDISTNTVLENFEIATDFARTSFEHSPIYDSAEFLKLLSDQQIDEIQNKFSKKDSEFQQWYEKHQKQGSVAERLKRIIKNTKRITDISLNAKQQEILKQGLDQIQSDPLNRHNIYNLWQAEFIQILEQRHQHDFKETISTHIDTYPNLIKLDNPDQYENNQKVAAKLLIQIVSSLDAEQKRALLNTVNKTRETLIAITNS